MEVELQRHEEPARGKGSRMARRRRQCGSGCLFKEGRGWAIRWREREIAPDGTIEKRLCYEALGNISRAEAGEILRRKMAEFGSNDGPTRSRVTFLTLAQQWEVDVLPTKVQALNAEESSTHYGEASDSAVWRAGT